MTACKILYRPFPVVFAFSALALAVALASQFAGGLEPCILCLYQRVPFVAAMIFAMGGMALGSRKNAAAAFLLLCALAFLTNTGIATYHSGVERQWWESEVKGCHVPTGTGDENWVEKILSHPAVPCTAIQWKDPVLGLTMANYNILLNLALFVFCAAALTVRRCPSGSERQTRP